MVLDTTWTDPSGEVGAVHLDVGNELITPLSPIGTVCIDTSANSHLTADLVGHVPAGSVGALSR